MTSLQQTKVQQRTDHGCCCSYKHFLQCDRFLRLFELAICFTLGLLFRKARHSLKSTLGYFGGTLHSPTDIMTRMQHRCVWIFPAKWPTLRSKKILFVSSKNLKFTHKQNSELYVQIMQWVAPRFTPNEGVATSLYCPTETATWPTRKIRTTATTRRCVFYSTSQVFWQL